MNVLTGASDE